MPSVVTAPLDKLLDLVTRDFVAWWYTKSISYGDDRFLRESRSTLNAFVSDVSARIVSLDSVEASTYVLQSVTTSLIREMRDQKDEERMTAKELEKTMEAEKARLVKRTRSACEEVGLALACCGSHTDEMTASLHLFATLGHGFASRDGPPHRDLDMPGSPSLFAAYGRTSNAANSSSTSSARSTAIG